MTDMVLVLLGLGAFFVLEAILFPYRKCKSCDGGKRWSPITTSWRNCGVCKGAGKQLRLVARLFRH